MDEFLPLEVATVRGISVASATWLIRDVVDLKARHPLLWLQATRGLIPRFRACALAAEVARFDLSVEQARALDERLAPKVSTLPWRRVLQLARGLVTEIAADKVTALQQTAREARFVRKLPTDDPAVAYLSARVDAADAIFFDATVDRIADIRGDTDLKDIRRAKAIGVLATPARAQLMLQRLAVRTARCVLPIHGCSRRQRCSCTSPRRPCCVASAGPGRGCRRAPGDDAQVPAGPFPGPAHTGHPALRRHGRRLLRNPEPIRRQVLLRDTVEVFPFPSRTPREADLDHTVPYRPGGKGQTRASNLGPLSRKPHRAKTHADWDLEQPRPGIFWWRTPTGQQYRFGPNGTSRIGRNPSHKAYEKALWDADHELGPPVQGVG